jgi:hypothetical protein
MSRRFEADTNALQTTGWSGPPDADDFPVRMKPLKRIFSLTGIGLHEPAV